jgi:hypothetical protein
MASALELNFTAPGPVADGFLLSRNEVDAIMGPQGGGKTSTLFWRLLFTAMEQEPHPVTGLRQFTFASLRENYRELWRTNVATWLEWFPESLPTFTGTRDNPADHHIRFRHPSGDGTIVDFHAMFRAIGDAVDLQAFFRGFNVTAFHLGEADLLSPDALQHARGRAGRYPRVDTPNRFKGATWRGVLLDFNAPDDENWIYKRFVEALPEGWGFWPQPSGLSPEAENVQNLVPGYYDRQMVGAEDWWIRRYIRNEFGYSREGKPVYPEYNDHLHCAKQELLPLPGIDVVIGLDQGLNPGAIWMQEAPDGQIRWLDELAADNIEAEEFGDMINKVNRDRYAGCNLVGVPDPAAWAQAAEAQDKRSWTEMVRRKTKLRMIQLPMKANLITVRLSTVRQPLTRLLGGQRPGLIISPRMKHTRKGFNSGYRYRRVKIGQGERYADTPEKNFYSNLHDAGQYGTLHIRGYAAVVGRETREAAAEQAARGSHAREVDYDPHNF